MEEGAPLHSSPSTPLCSTPLFSSTPTEDSPLLGNYKATVSVRFVEYQSTEQEVRVGRPAPPLPPAIPPEEDSTPLGMKLLGYTFSIIAGFCFTASNVGIK